MSLAQRIPVPFPHAGSLAWLRPEPGRDAPVQVRIVQYDARDGTVRVSEVANDFPREQATATRRVDRAQLAETEDAALQAVPRRRSRKRTK